MLKKFPLDKTTLKKCTFVLSRAPIHHSVTFNSRFLCELKHKNNKSEYRIFKEKHGLFDIKTSTFLSKLK